MNTTTCVLANKVGLSGSSVLSLGQDSQELHLDFLLTTRS